ncbi:MAG: hypothetical protein O2960_24620 [Verrucomicrobia bacterium]|nr:hypothetical protein [Verrucomicrobiota bacterium]
MLKKPFLSESELAASAKAFRLKSGKKKAAVGREMEVRRSTIQLAEENPEQSLTRLRIRIIEKYSPYKVVGPVYFLERK